MHFPVLSDIQQAHKRIRPYIHHTPILTSENLNRITGADIYFKCENFQKAGAFKIRGACNAVFSLTKDEALAGVTTHSSGNHAAAIALAAKWRGIKSFVVMPENAPQVKKDAVAGYGAEIIFCKPTLQAREETLDDVVKKTGARFIHPYNNPHVIAGQGTAALELLEETGELDIVLTPVGGGGLLSGTCLTTSALFPRTSVIAAEPSNADDAFRSLKAGKIIPVDNPDTIADGLRTSLGSLTFPIIQKYVSEIITVCEEDIINAMRLAWERLKIIIEPSSAVPLAAVLANPDKFRNKRTGIILSGGNVDLSKIPWL
ncbi:MAG: pyridoxal-phosphate dependent enzyme [Calditrichaceae bacterium]